MSEKDESLSVNGEERTQSRPHMEVSDLSSEEETHSNITELRRERRKKRQRKREGRLKKCCTGCDSHNPTEYEVSVELPAPLALTSGIRQCDVIKTFENVVGELYNSEDEINAAIDSFSHVGNRLAHVHDAAFSDVELHDSYDRAADTPSSDPDILVCDYSNSVGEKLAKKNDVMPPCNGTADHDTSDNTPESTGGLLLSDQRLSGIVTDNLTVEHLQELLRELTRKLKETNEELVEHVKEKDSLQGQKGIVLKHIAELTSLVQGKRANGASAFRRIIVPRETHF